MIEPVKLWIAFDADTPKCGPYYFRSVHRTMEGAVAATCEDRQGPVLEEVELQD